MWIIKWSIIQLWNVHDKCLCAPPDIYHGSSLPALCIHTSKYQVILSHDVNKHLIVIDDPFCGSGSCSYPFLLSTKKPFIRSDPYSRQNRILLGASISREKISRASKKASKHSFWIVSSGNVHSFGGSVNLQKSFRALSSEKWRWKSQVLTLGCVRRENKRHVQ